MQEHFGTGLLVLAGLHAGPANRILVDAPVRTRRPGLEAQGTLPGAAERALMGTRRPDLKDPVAPGLRHAASEICVRILQAGRSRQGPMPNMAGGIRSANGASARVFLYPPSIPPYGKTCARTPKAARPLKRAQAPEILTAPPIGKMPPFFKDPEKAAKPGIHARPGLSAPSMRPPYDREGGSL